MTNVNPAASFELGTAMVRASLDAALRSGAQASAAFADITKLQSETLARLMDETLRTMQLVSGAPASAAAGGEWAKIYQDHLQQSAASARTLWENALRAQSEIGELGSRMMAASARSLAQSLDQIARTMEEGAGRTTPESPQTAEAGVRRREKAA